MLLHWMFLSQVSEMQGCISKYRKYYCRLDNKLAANGLVFFPLLLSAQFQWLSAMEIAVLWIDKYFVYGYVKSHRLLNLFGIIIFHDWIWVCALSIHGCFPVELLYLLHKAVNENKIFFSGKKKSDFLNINSYLLQKFL